MNDKQEQAERLEELEEEEEKEEEEEEEEEPETEESVSNEKCGSSQCSNKNDSVGTVAIIADEAIVTVNNNSSQNISIGSTPSNHIETKKIIIENNQILNKTQEFGAHFCNENIFNNLIKMFNQHNRILGRNLNGTIAMTTQPSNESELQLYRVLQRANLLAYYDTFICQGGDDVQQLYEAGEEEFLEIMALVGMAAKPLHVRRLQKALHEWATNPALFQSPLVPPFQNTTAAASNSIVPTAAATIPPPPPPPLAATSSSSSSSTATTTTGPTSNANNTNNNNSNANSDGMEISHRSTRSSSSSLIGSSSNHSQSLSNHHHHHSHHHSHHNNNNNHQNNRHNNSPGLTGTGIGPAMLFQTATGSGNQSKTPSPSQFPNVSSNDYSQPCSPSSMTPILMENQIQRLSDAAETLVKNLNPSTILEWKTLNHHNNNGNKKRFAKEIENIMNMSVDDPRRMDEIRKYAAIYGRFDCKRKPEKPLTLHEVCVNEAAAQICSKIPSLLCRRDELFPLARQVVRDSGYQYSKGHSRSQSCRIGDDIHSGESSIKRIRLDVSGSSCSPVQESKASSVHEEDRKRRHNRLEGIVDQLKSLGSKQEEIQSQIKDANERQNFQEVNELQNELNLINDHQIQLVNEKSELEEQQQKIDQQHQQQPQNQQQKILMEKSNRNVKLLVDIPSGEKTETDDTDSQFSLYSNESSTTPSLLQDSHSSPSVGNDLANVSNSKNNNNEINLTTTTTTTKSTKKKIGHELSGNGNSTANSNNGLVANNSDDSMDFGKQLNEVIDEGLRLMGHVMEENLDLRFFNKYTEALRNIPEPTATATTTTSSNGPAAGGGGSNNGGSNFRIKGEGGGGGGGGRRGRPPKNLNNLINNTNNSTTSTNTTTNNNSSNNGSSSNNNNNNVDLSSNVFYEQLLSQQMQTLYQTQLQQSLYAHCGLFGAGAGATTSAGSGGINANDFNSAAAAAAALVSSQAADTFLNHSSSSDNNNLNQSSSIKTENDFQIGTDSLIKQITENSELSSSTTNTNNNQLFDRDEIVQSLSALISMSNNNNNNNNDQSLSINKSSTDLNTPSSASSVII